ncbi:MAG: MarR family transcriptional regulator [Proteobacteria bacterium]|nr:MarR family transcriptional regulator [Pseudomonadota bacterium]
MQRQRRTRSAPALTHHDYKLLADFRHVLRQFHAFSEERATDLGLAPQQHQALLTIKGCGSAAPTVGDLARHLVIRHNSAVGLVNRLVSAGLVARHADPDDRRRVSLTLTEDGETLLAKLTTTHRAELRRIAPLLRELLQQLSE